jgi:hypothetical protein
LEAPSGVARPESDATKPPRISAPLTERVLGRLGSPRWFWIIVWASTGIAAPLLLLAVLAALGESDRVQSVSDLVIPQAALAYAVVLCIWGVGRLFHGAGELEPQLTRLTQSEVPATSLLGRGRLAGPILLTTIISVVNTVGSASLYGPVPAITILPLLALSLLAIMTFVWSYLELLVGLDRLGRARLALDPFPQDRSLGLRGVGSLAFAGFVILFAAAIPILVTSSSNLNTVALSLGVVGIVVLTFILSMWRLHGQMAEAKARYVADTRAAYAAAYAPLHAGLSVEALAAQAPALGAAQALADRAERIQQWPVDEGMTAWVAIIVTGVVTSLIVRLIFAAAGL